MVRRNQVELESRQQLRRGDAFLKFTDDLIGSIDSTALSDHAFRLVVNPPRPIRAMNS